MPPRHDKNQGLYHYKDGTWGIDCYIFGRRVRRKIGGKQEARDELARLKSEEKTGRVDLLPRSVGRKLLGEWIDLYLEMSKGDTNQVYGRMWKHFCARMLPEELTILTLRTWTAKQQEAGVSPASVHRKLSVLRAVYNLAIRTGEITTRESPFLDPKALSLPKINNLREHLFAVEQLTGLADRMGMWWVYMEFSLITGIRFGSLAKLRWDDVDFDRAFAMLWSTKNGFRQPIPLNTRAIRILNLQKERFPDSPWCFPAERGGQLNRNNFRNRVWAPAFRAVGLDEATWHDIRHNTASLLVQMGEDLYTVQRFLGQNDARMVQRYAHLGMGRMREAAQRLDIESIPETK